jgi:hypothetical protein
VSVARAIGPIDAATARRFWAYVDRKGDEECWLWRGCTSDGYGRFTLYKRGVNAHRVSYAIANNGVPELGVICHRCDTPGCVNPRHLFCGTHKDNALDCTRKGRHSRSKFTRADVEAMRALREANLSYGMIGSRYGVSKGHVRALLHGTFRLKDE